MLILLVALPPPCCFDIDDTICHYFIRFAAALFTLRHFRYYAADMLIFSDISLMRAMIMRDMRFALRQRFSLRRRLHSL